MFNGRCILKLCLLFRPNILCCCTSSPKALLLCSLLHNTLPSCLLLHARACGVHYAMLCSAMQCYAVLCYAMPCYAMPCYAMLCHAMLCCAMLRSFKWYIAELFFMVLQAAVNMRKSPAYRVTSDSWIHCNTLQMQTIPLQFFLSMSRSTSIACFCCPESQHQHCICLLP